MFDLVRNNKRVVQVFLLLITVPFALWGVEAYINQQGPSPVVATVGNIKITQAEFEEELQKQQERLRQNFGSNFDPKMLDTPDARRAIIEGLVNARVLTAAARQARLTISDDQLRKLIESAPVMQQDGKFSPERYEAFLRNQNLNAKTFEARLREDMIQQQLMGALGQSGFASVTAGERWIQAMDEQRELSAFEVKPDAFLAQAKVAADAVKKFYDTNPKHFETPERVRAEFVVLSQDFLAREIKVSEDEIKKRYESHADRYREPEQRQASHILIAVAAQASEDQQKAAKARAEDLLKQVRANPAQFAKLAGQHSDDPGSKTRGGDLGYFGRGTMVKPFEDATFALKPNEVSELVRSDFGYHIIQLTGIMAAKARPLADARGEIEAELVREAAAKRYSESAEGFSNLVFEQADSLKPAADKYKLKVERSDWVNRGGPGLWPLTNPKLVESLFSDDAIKNKRNTEVIDLSNNTLVAARVLEHSPAQLRSFESARAEIEAKLQGEEAARLAQAAGVAALADLQKGGTGSAMEIKWSPSNKVTRMNRANMPPALADAVFGMPADKVPNYAGVVAPNGHYVLLRLSAVHKAEALNPQQREQMLRRYERVQVEEELVGLLKGLRQQMKVDIKRARVEAQ